PAQGPVREHPPPLQPATAAPGPPEADSVTDVPCVKEALQVEPQSMPAGLLVTVPVPVPLLVTVRVKEPGGGGGGGAPLRLNVAVIVDPPLTTHALRTTLPQPVHLTKAEPESAAAVRVTGF